MTAPFHHFSGSGSRDGCRAFTLLELMVTISIIVVLTSLVVPAVHSTLDSGHLTQAANQIVTAFSFAAEKAATENRTITVRLISGTDGEYRYLQLVEIAADGVSGKALDRAVTLPESVAMARNERLSSFFSLPEKTPGASDPSISNLGRNYHFREVKFRPGGRLSLGVGDKWFLTVFSISKNTGADTPPPNFATIQLDPVDTRLSIYRP